MREIKAKSLGRQCLLASTLVFVQGIFCMVWVMPWTACLLMFVSGFGVMAGLTMLWKED